MRPPPAPRSDGFLGADRQTHVAPRMTGYAYLAPLVTDGLLASDFTRGVEESPWSGALGQGRKRHTGLRGAAGRPEEQARLVSQTAAGTKYLSL